MINQQSPKDRIGEAGPCFRCVTTGRILDAREEVGDVCFLTSIEILLQNTADRQYDVYNYIFLMRSISISHPFPQGLTH